MLPEIEHLSLKYRNNKTGGVWLVRTTIYGDEPGSYNNYCIDITNYSYASVSLEKVKNEMFRNWGDNYIVSKLRLKNEIEYMLTDRWNSPQVSVTLEILHMSDD